MTVNYYLNKFVQKQSLSQEEASDLLQILLHKETTPAQIGAILSALTIKGETTDEIAGFIGGMREKMITIQVPKGTIDVCGTGGDGKHTFNISTAASFVLAGGGVFVAKHGNRAASSLCGSADVLEALGVNIQLTVKQAEKVLQKTGFVFLFAPLYHGAFKEVGSVRKSLGFPTIFNYLGPFASPAQVRRQVIGVPNKQIAHILAVVAATLSYEHLFILTSEDGMDEASIFAPTHVFDIQGENIREYSIIPKQFSGSDISEIIGADAKTNAQIIEKVLQGEKSYFGKLSMKAARDIVVLNSAVGFVVAGKAATIKKGIDLAKKSIDTGSALRVLTQVKKETNK